MASIKLNLDNRTYELEFDKATVKWCDAQGLTVDNLSQYPMTYIPILVQGAFRKNHRYLSNSTIDDLYKRIPQKTEFIAKLMELYVEPINALMGSDETEEYEEKNEIWTLVPNESESKPNLKVLKDK